MSSSGFGAFSVDSLRKQAFAAENRCMVRFWREGRISNTTQIQK
jgi:hypothetical protein